MTNTPKTISQKEMAQPFKFLDAYQKGDEDKFFGRKQETKDLIDALNKSSIVILYGPSGSGKSSLINCGLINRLSVNADKVFEIRRTKDIFTPLAAKLFAKNAKNQQGKFIEILEHIFNFKEALKKAIDKLKKINNKIFHIKSAYRNGTILEAAMNVELGRVSEERTLIKKQIEHIKQVILSNEKRFIELFNSFLSKLNAPPYLIFDQFEEIFTAGDPDEITKFGIFLSLVYDNNFQVKTLLSLREEYFSKLSKLEAYIPQILYRKCLVDNPNQSTIQLIIERSFERFNINQQVTDKKELTKKIVKKLTSSENRRQKYHLPFLQIYLDKLHKESFDKIYSNGVGNEVVLNKYGYPPITFSKKGIDRFGDIQMILNKYILEIDDGLRADINQLPTEINLEKYSVIRFLKNFGYSDNTKKRIQVKKINILDNEKIESTYKILEPEFNQQLQWTLWNKVSPTFNEPISQIIDCLIKHGLLKHNDEYLELSHDILAKIVSEFSIERSRIELLKERFNNYFEDYNREGPVKFLSQAEIADFKRSTALNYILDDDDKKIAGRKMRFWEASKKNAEQKQEKRSKKLTIWKVLSSFFILITMVMGIFWGIEHFFIADEKDKKSQLSSDKILAEKETYKNTAEAFDNAEHDRTEVIKSLTNSRDYLKSKIKSITSQSEKKHHPILERIKKIWGVLAEQFISEPPHLINSFENELYKDFSKYPFYFQQVTLDDPYKSPIISAKHKIVQNAPDSVHIYFLTQEKHLDKHIDKHLFELILDGEKKIISIQPIGKNIDAYHPMALGNGKKEILIIKDGSLYSLDETGNFELLENRYNGQLTDPQALVQLHSNSTTYVTHSGNKIFEFSRNKKGKWKGKRSFSLGGRSKVVDIEPYAAGYMVLFENGNFWYSKNSCRKSKCFVAKTVAKSIYGTKKNLYLVGTEDKLFRPTNLNKVDREAILHSHEDAIISIDYLPEGERLILGGEDGRASIWKGDEKKKILLGHEDQINTVGFLDEGGDFVYTASSDSTLKIWNLRTVELNTIKIPTATSIKKLAFNKVDSMIYVGTYSKKPEGNLFAISQTGTTKTFTQDFVREKENKGHITSFDFGRDNSLIVGSLWNQLISSTKEHSTIKVRLSNNPSRINDIKIHEKILVAATDKGLVVYQNYIESGAPKNTTREKKIFNEDIVFNAIDIDRSGRWVIAAGGNKHIYIYRIEKKGMNRIYKKVVHTNRVTDVVFSASGNYFVSGGADNMLKLWRKKGEGFQVIKSYKVHTNDITDVVFYGDDLFLSASNDGTVQIFRREKGDEFLQIPSLIRHDTEITAATFSADGKYIYSGDATGAIKKWAFWDFPRNIEERLGIEDIQE